MCRSCMSADVLGVPGVPYISFDHSVCNSYCIVMSSLGMGIRSLNSELQLIAKEELHENPDQIHENLDIIKKWLEKSPHLRARKDDQFLVTFLRGCKYSLEKTKQKIDAYYTYRTHLVDFMGNRDPLRSEMREIMRLGITLPLPITGSLGSPRVILFRYAAYDPSKRTMEDAFRHITMVNDVLLNEDDNSIVSGQLYVGDLANITMAHMTQLNPALIKKTFMICQESSPIRIKGIHYINATKSFEHIFNIIKGFLNKKMRSRLFMHSSMDSFYKMVPRFMMPIEYDGEAGSVQTLVDEWEKKLLSYRDYFIDETFGVDENKRIGAATNPLLGIDVNGLFAFLSFFQIFKSSDDTSVIPEISQLIKEELHENPDQIHENLDIIKKWLEKSPHLRARKDDQFLVTFLRGCKYSLEKTKQKIDMYYTYRTNLVEFIGNRDPLRSEMREIMRLGTTVPLPITGGLGSPRVVFFRFAVCDPSKRLVEDAFRHFIMVNDVLLNEDDNSVVSGQLYILDLANITMGHITQLNPVLLKKAFMICQDSSPIRIKGIHYINAPKSFEHLFNIVKSILNEKMKKRLFMHSSMDTFYKMIPRKMMPIEYEGEAGSIQILVDEWEKKLLSYRDYFLDKTFGVDENKRIGGATNPLLGIDGSFKKLEFD
ncbi:Alpha-tocopherol transfer protein-like [Pseudolycoriella hygida]|uniref:Alpha-tocopherol transfer protein-like n=1 Tax=Pseudolycoriella hygida TaxID=35572 RepID=A0A9Q0NGC3_9DIPT|nr:Alpha-tocopherol transfer protein-like [Pseudolycoriella hygida]